MTDNLPPLPDFGPIHTEPSGKVEMYPAAFRECLSDMWKQGARAALAQAQSCVPADFEAAYAAAVRDSAPGTIKDIARLCFLAASPQPQPVQPSERGHIARPDLNKFAHEHHWQRPDGSVYCVDSSD